MKLAFGSNSNTFFFHFLLRTIGDLEAELRKAQKQRQHQNKQSRRSLCFQLSVGNRWFWLWFSSTSDTANCVRQKWEKESQVSQRSEFLTLPIFDSHNWEAEGQWQCGRLSLLTFFGEAKKVSGRRATPGQLTLIITKSQ
ncbi:hypothetical protein H8K35_08030 [Undibacterium sp. LX40W]|uniref:Uncharacterized protein n=1 Tax=Undibacterium nitidum TaxID=2762298 RepID=A0A923HPP1_9BURK|nr:MULTISPECIES: hypothetical protein [Undibacterium]MBC3881618.1 hypothetical protein [Undibacterium nitidum]MBC3891599.1 hypothetical protein [Undibacterium sp. LX40W]